MTTIALGLTAACGYSLYNLFSQRLLRSVSWMTITVAMFATGIVLLGVPALVVDGLPGGAALGKYPGERLGSGMRRKGRGSKKCSSKALTA